MPKKQKISYVIYSPEKKKYLAYRFRTAKDDLAPWNSKINWTLDKKQAMQFYSEEAAKWAMMIYKSYTNVDINYEVQTWISFS